MPQSSQPQTPPSPQCDPEYIAIILAATQGARLFPLTSEYPSGVPKHLLPLSPLNSSSGGGGDAGNGGMAPLLERLLVKTYESGFDMVVVAVHEEDNMTVPFLLGKGIGAGKNDTSCVGLCKKLSKENETLISTSSIGDGDVVSDLEFHGYDNNSTTSKKSKAAAPKRWMHVRVVHLPENCHGSADALRFLSQGNNSRSSSEGGQSRESASLPSSPTKGGAADGQAGSECNNFCFIPRTSHAVVMPGDLIMEGSLVSQVDTQQQSSQDGIDVLSLLVQAHRRWNANGDSGAACTMLLTDVGAEDKEGVPLKESSKAKTGLLSREEEDMEYVGLSSEIAPPLSSSLAALSFSKSSSGNDSASGALPSRRVVLKRSKLEVEEDEGTGSTPKLGIPKRRLHAAGGTKRRSNKNDLASIISGGLLSMSSTATIDHSPSISLRTDLHDVHLYVISNWVFELMHARPSMQSFQSEVLPLLISRQYRGIEAAFGPTAWKKDEGNRERLQKVLKEMDGAGNVADGKGVTCNKVSTLLGMYSSGKMSGGLGSFIPPEDDDDDANPASDEMGTTATPKAADVSSSSLLSPPTFPTTKHPFAVSAQVLSRGASKLTLRACTLPSLLYGCGEITSRTLKLDAALSSNLVPKGTKLNTKFNSILMPGCTVGEKVQTKSCTIGANVTLGDRAKLNNVVVLDGASVGSNTVLQNSVVGVGAKVGENCNLKDCQVGPGAEVAGGTRTTEKGETFEA